MCTGGGISTGKKCLKYRRMYIHGGLFNFNLKEMKHKGIPLQGKGFLCNDLNYLKKYKDINSSVKCKELCWKDPKCELSLYKRYSGKSGKKPECYNKTTNYKKSYKKNGKFYVESSSIHSGRGGRASLSIDEKKFSDICQNPSKNSKNYIGKEREIPSKNAAGWEKQNMKSLKRETWDHLFFKPVN